MLNNKIFIKNDNFVLLTVEGNYFVLPNTTEGILAEKLFSLDEVGKYIYDFIDGINMVEDITNKIVHDYDVTKEQAAMDVENFILNLQEQKVIEEKK